ncbi:hypothetical protein HDG35_006329 [Paraburkholderia sp. JPY681]|nr:hypothetical protein [Paraburkholderia atlantica]
MQDVETELRANVRGEVRFDAGSKALYASDASNYRQIPLGVVVPVDIKILSQRSTYAIARTFHL